MRSDDSSANFLHNLSTIASAGSNLGVGSFPLIDELALGSVVVVSQWIGSLLWGHHNGSSCAGESWELILSGVDTARLVTKSSGDWWISGSVNASLSGGALLRLEADNG